MARAVAAPAERRRSIPRPAVRIAPRLLAWAASVSLVLLALGLRLPHVATIPRFTDETDEVMWSVAIARGEHLPLTNILSYMGAGFNYVIAAAVLIFGPDPVLPRYVVLATGILTVGATFLLARELALSLAGAPDLGRSELAGASEFAGVPETAVRRETMPGRHAAVAVGLIAATILAVSPVHVIVNSRLGYSHSMTPLVTTLALWLLARAARRRSGPSFAGAGLLFGVALQSHPTVVGLLPGAGAFVLWRMRPLLLSRWGALAIVLGGLGCANLIVHNLLTDFGSVREAMSKSAAYTVERTEAPEPYAVALVQELQGLARTLAGAIGDRRFGVTPLFQPATLAWIVLAPLSVLLAARRGLWLPLLLIPPFLLILPPFNAKFEPLFNGRYLMPLVPVFAATVSLLAVASWRTFGRVGAAGPARALLAAAVVLLVASPIPALWEYEGAAIAEGGNAPYFELADRIARERGPDEHVLLDSDLGGVRLSSARDGVGVVEYLLDFRPNRVPATSARVDEVTALARIDPYRYLLVLLPSSRQKLETRFRLTLVGRAPAPPGHRLADVRLYRVREVR